MGLCIMASLQAYISSGLYFLMFAVLHQRLYNIKLELSRR